MLVIFFFVKESNYTLVYKTLLRCLKQNPEKAKHFKQCKYNAMHFHRHSEIEQHERECPDRNRDEDLLKRDAPFRILKLSRLFSSFLSRFF